MKIHKIPERKLNRLTQKLFVKTGKEQPKPPKLVTPAFDARRNLERFAEDMNPAEYISARKYLADIEMTELLKSGI